MTPHTVVVYIRAESDDWGEEEFKAAQQRRASEQAARKQ